MKTTTRRFLLPVQVCALALFGLFTVAQAATISHGDFAADTVTYTNVTESSSTDPVPLFGTPVTSGDQLSFFEPVPLPNPSNGFGANASGGSGDVTDAFLSFMVESSFTGFGVSNLEISEGGDYSLGALGNALAKVQANLIATQVRIDEVDNVAITPVVLSGVDSASFELPGDPDVGLWSNSLSFDLDAALTNANVPFQLGATKVTVRLNDSLLALSQPGSVANIIKKNFDVDVDTRFDEQFIPEPTTLGMALIGVVVVAAGRRRQA